MTVTFSIICWHFWDDLFNKSGSQEFLSIVIPPLNWNLLQDPIITKNISINNYQIRIQIYRHKHITHPNRSTILQGVFDLHFTSVMVLGLQFHCRQRAPVGTALSSSVTSQLCMFDIQATTKNKYYDHIVLLYLESRRCRYRSIIFVCFYLYVSVVNLIDYSDIDKMMDINNEKC